MPFGRWFGYEREGLVAGWATGESGVRTVVWLEKGGSSLVFVEFAGHLRAPVRPQLEKALKMLGADCVVASCLTVNLPSFWEEADAIDARPIIDQAKRLTREAKSKRRSVTVDLRAFVMPIPGHDEAAAEPAGLVRLQCGDDRLGIVTLPAAVTPADKPGRWLAELGDTLNFDWVCGWWGPTPDVEKREAVSPMDVKQFVAEGDAWQPVEGPTWRTIGLRAMAREVDSESLSQALAESRVTDPGTVVPSRRAFAEGDDTARAYFAGAELAAAANRNDRFLQLTCVQLGAVRILALPGAPVRPLAKRIREQAADGEAVWLVIDGGGGGGVLTAWTLYKECDYETQAAFAPHSISTGDYLVKAATSLLRD